MLKHPTAFALLVTGLFFSLWLMVAANGGGLIDHSIENSRQFLSDFQATTRFVGAFRAARGRMPSNDELNAWSHANVRSGEPLILSPDDGQFGEEAVAALGRPPGGGYLLGVWRGEWMEYYASWSGQSTLSFNQDGYYLLGSQLMDMLLSGLLAFISIAGAILIWTGKRVATKGA